MTRSRRHIEPQAGSLESFVDVVCNLIGGLLLIAVISALAARDRVFEVFSPVEDVRAREARSYKFAVTEKGVYPLDQNDAFEKLFVAYQRNPDAGIVHAQTRFCEWTLDRDRDRLMCRMKKAPPPFTDSNVASIVWDKSVVKRQSSKEGEYFAYFFVSPDDAAFRLFRLARKAFWKEEIRVGWGPVDPREGIIFGGGIKLRPQD
ncbi:MAG: hypothetical protein FJY85_07370 [Deltaproteobacteria bacterium]|nr:hypothetical protein [Deltaproteobacteria bacterium]